MQAGDLEGLATYLGASALWLGNVGDRLRQSKELVDVKLMQM